MWGQIHGFDAHSPEAQAEMKKSMMPLLIVQFIGTVVTTVVLALFVDGLPVWNIYGIAGFLWLGFVVPTQVSAVLFGGTNPKWVVKKIAIMAGCSFACLMAAAAILGVM
jgi:hypothetical protein